MVFVAPNWWEGLLINIGIYLGLFVLTLGITILIVLKTKKNIVLKIIGLCAGFCIAIIITTVAGGFIWYESYELPSVNEKIITVSSFEPVPGIETNDNGMMIINNADQIMVVDSEGNGWFNKEASWFQKWDTRDVLNQLKINGTYKIKYYGWRNPFNSGFPNILSIEEAIDETNATKPNYNELFGVKFTGF